MPKKEPNRFYEEAEEGLKFSTEEVTEEERKRAEALWKELGKTK